MPGPSAEDRLMDEREERQLRAEIEVDEGITLGPDLSS